MPILRRAQSALDTLTTADIAIVRAMKKPPGGVRLILESVCVLKVDNLLYSLTLHTDRSLFYTHQLFPFFFLFFTSSYSKSNQSEFNNLMVHISKIIGDRP